MHELIKVTITVARKKLSAYDVHDELLSLAGILLPGWDPLAFVWLASVFVD